MNKINQPLTVNIPATIDRAITPNGLPNTANGLKKRHRLQQELKETTMWAVKGLGRVVMPEAPWRLDYVVARAKGKQALDDDNIKASLKYVQDGIADVSGLNDRHMVIGEVKQIRDPQSVGYIEVTIRTQEAQVAS